ncbi:MAG: hypothetical protein ACI32N_10265 [Bulleidia sp.]
MSEIKGNCPVCPRHCDLNDPHCDRGRTYAQTGRMPEEKGHGHGARLQFDNPDQQLIMKYLHHAVNAADRGGFTQDMAGSMFEVLSDEETVTLKNLLEKLSDNWMKKAPQKMERSHHHEHH